MAVYDHGGEVVVPSVPECEYTLCIICICTYTYICHARLYKIFEDSRHHGGPIPVALRVGRCLEGLVGLMAYP